MADYEATPVVFDGANNWLSRTAESLPDTGEPRSFVFGPGPDGRYSLHEIELPPPSAGGPWHTILVVEEEPGDG